MILEFTEEEFKLLLMSVEDKCSRLLANCFNANIQQDARMFDRCVELHTQFNELERKLLAICENEKQNIRKVQNIMNEDLELYCKNAVNDYRGDFTKLSFKSFELIDNSDEESEDEHKYFILTVDGGLNGRGQFLFYLEDVAKLVKKLMTRFNYVWLIDWINDCPDDVFSLKIGLKF